MSGMKSMTNRHFVRRALLTAAITATATTDTSFALGFENGIEQVDYQPGQPGQMPPQGNTTVTQELNRMFQESGQPMPSMNERICRMPTDQFRARCSLVRPKLRIMQFRQSQRPVPDSWVGCLGNSAETPGRPMRICSLLCHPITSRRLPRRHPQKE